MQSAQSEILNVIREIAWPIVVAVLAFFLVRLIKTLDRVDKTCNSLDKTVTAQEKEQKTFREFYTREQQITENRLNAHAQMLDCHDRDIATLKERTNHGKG